MWDVNSPLVLENYYLMQKKKKVTSLMNVGSSNVFLFYLHYS